MGYKYIYQSSNLIFNCQILYKCHKLKLHLYLVINFDFMCFNYQLEEATTTAYKVDFSTMKHFRMPLYLFLKLLINKPDHGYFRLFLLPSLLTIISSQILNNLINFLLSCCFPNLVNPYLVIPNLFILHFSLSNSIIPNSSISYFVIFDLLSPRFVIPSLVS